MRLPMQGDVVDWDQTSRMVDLFLEAGFNYFDTARVYLDRQSEQAVKRCLADRYPRARFLLADKLSDSCFRTQEDIRPLVQRQLDSCGPPKDPRRRMAAHSGSRSTTVTFFPSPLSAMAVSMPTCPAPITTTVSPTSTFFASAS